MKFKILLFMFILIFFLAIFIKYKDCKDDNYLIEVMNSHLEYRLNLLNSEKAIQKKIIGEKLKLPKNLSAMITSNTILIVESELANKKSYYDILRLYQGLIEEEHYIIANIIAVIPTKNSGYLRAISMDFSKKIKFFADTTFFFKKELDIQDSENVVILMDSSATCLYAYLLEIDNPLRDMEEAEIILNILKSRWNY